MRVVIDMRCVYLSAIWNAEWTLVDLMNLVDREAKFLEGYEPKLRFASLLDD